MPSPEKRLFVIRQGKQETLQEYLEQNCRPLYGSDVFVDDEGSIFYPVWYPADRTQVTSKTYRRLSRKLESEESYLNRPLTTLTPYELRICQVTKDSGSVEAAIRSVEHALTKYLPANDNNQDRGRERKQVAAVKDSVSCTLDLFGSRDFSAITEEELAKGQLETLRRLISVGLDPDRVMLEEKKRMARWVIKASGGKDSLGRRNLLITTYALEAAYRRAIARELGIGETATKFIRMREALRFERQFSREIFQEARDRCRQMPIHAVFKYPDRQPPGSQLNIVRGILNTTIWQLEQPHVKPYRPVGRLTAGFLKENLEFLDQAWRKKIIRRGVFPFAERVLAETLLHQKDIYPPVPSTGSATASTAPSSSAAGKAA